MIRSSRDSHQTAIRRFRQPALGHWLVVLLVAIPSIGCQKQLMPTPNLYAYGHDDAFDRVLPAHRNNLVDVMYVTDRMKSGDSDNGPTYGYGRSHSMAFGSCVVEIGRDVSWDELSRASRSRDRTVSLPLTVRTVRELGRYPELPIPIVEPGPPPVEDPAAVARFAATEAALHEELERRLAATDRKHVFLYVHGFNNTFEDAVFTKAELWHFLGRQGVPVCYTWPAGRGLSGQGYVYDSVSCEFTILHFRQLLEALGRCPSVEKVHILAHSRGTAIVTSALRELHLQQTYAPQTAREKFKLGNLVLAAADLDLDVVQQRLSAERIGRVPENGVLYTSPDDRALELADILTLGVARLGQLQATELTPRFRQAIETSPITFVQALVRAGYIGHSYFTDSPAVSSDIILFLRDNRPPGAEHGRPLTERIPNFYVIRDDYLRPPK